MNNSNVNWKTWIPDGTFLTYSEKNRDNWESSKVIDSRIFKINDENLHVVLFDNEDSITFSVNDMNENGTQGTHKIDFNSLYITYQSYDLI